MVLLRNLIPKDTLDLKYKPSFRICKKISDKDFDIQDNSGKVKHVSMQHLQLLHPAEHVLTNLPGITSFGCTTKYIKPSPDAISENYHPSKELTCMTQ